MNENDKQAFGVEATANPAPSQGRRRLVKALVIATPAIVTVRRGSAQAAQSVSTCTPCPDGDQGPGSLACYSSLFPQENPTQDNANDYCEYTPQQESDNLNFKSKFK